jgi:hypothetical protein
MGRIDNVWNKHLPTPQTHSRLKKIATKIPQLQLMAPTLARVDQYISNDQSLSAKVAL